MKTISRQELIEKSKAVFAAHPREVNLFATSDGQFFIIKDRAKLHSRSNKDLRIFEIDREETKEAKNEASTSTAKGKTNGKQKKQTSKPKANPVLDQSVADLKKAIEKEADAEKLQGLIEAEKKAENRTTAISAIEDRIAALNDQKEDPKAEAKTSTGDSDDQKESAKETTSESNTEEDNKETKK